MSLVRKITFTLFVLVLFVAAGCTQSNTLDTGASDEVTFSVVEDDETQVTIPLAYFGEDESDVTGKSIQVYKDGTLYIDDVDAEDYLDNSVVAFKVSGVDDGDDLEVKILDSDGDTVDSFDASLSDSEEQTSAGENSDDGSEGSDTPGADIAEAVCAKIADCVDDTDADDCEDAVMELDGGLGISIMDENLQEDEDSGITFEEVDSNVEDGDYVVDADALESCISDLEDLDCDDVEEEASDADFSYVENLVDCQDILSDGDTGDN